MDDVKVSVICLCYNHEKYIRKALDGFVMQKTNFKYEVLIHDDASTDNSANIIREYAEKYDFIKPVFQTENMYSKKIGISRTFLYPLVKGKYIAYCEGDDYWFDENKLQKQYDFLENNPEYVAHYHAYNKINEADTEILETCYTMPTSGDVSEKDIIMYKKPQQIASQMYRAEVDLERPACFLGYEIGDYPRCLYAITKGKIYYSSEVMSNYRVLTPNSWTKTIFRKRELREKHYNDLIKIANMFNEYTDKLYDEYVSEKLMYLDFELKVFTYDYKGVKKSELFKTASRKRKLATYLGVVFPKLARRLEEYFVRKGKVL